MLTGLINKFTNTTREERILTRKKVRLVKLESEYSSLTKKQIENFTDFEYISKLDNRLDQLAEEIYETRESIKVYEQIIGYHSKR